MSNLPSAGTYDRAYVEALERLANAAIAYRAMRHIENYAEIMRLGQELDEAIARFEDAKQYRAT